jgi:hypothetical protein
MAQVEAKIQMNLNLYKLLGNLQRLLFHLSKKNMTAKSTFRMSEPERSIIFRVMGR